ncbi:MAG: N-acetylmuramoyl-L-alanine amidase [Clostridiales bacterium]|nr:N-acetylmuramoyl-L-alanine amidase [Clostridiales bacterium]
MNHAKFRGGSGDNQTSWHYTVDADEVWQSFEDNRICWHAGNATGNNYSIAIEICVNDKVGFAKACDNANEFCLNHAKSSAELTADLLIKHGPALMNFAWFKQNS